MFQTKLVENIKTRVLFNNFFLNRAFYKIMWKKILQSRAGHRWQYGACALHSDT